MDEEDILSFSSFLREKMKLNIGHAASSSVAFRSLQEVTLAYIILFNKRRSGEVSRMLMTHYNELVDGIWKNNKEIESLDHVLRSLATTMNLTFIPGIVVIHGLFYSSIKHLSE